MFNPLMMGLSQQNLFSCSHIHFSTVDGSLAKRNVPGVPGCAPFLLGKDNFPFFPQLVWGDLNNSGCNPIHSYLGTSPNDYNGTCF